MTSKVYLKSQHTLPIVKIAIFMEKNKQTNHISTFPHLILIYNCTKQIQPDTFQKKTTTITS